MKQTSAKGTPWKPWISILKTSYKFKIFRLSRMECRSKFKRNRTTGTSSIIFHNHYQKTVKFVHTPAPHDEGLGVGI